MGKGEPSPSGGGGRQPPRPGLGPSSQPSARSGSHPPFKAPRGARRQLQSSATAPPHPAPPGVQGKQGTVAASPTLCCCSRSADQPSAARPRPAAGPLLLLSPLRWAHLPHRHVRGRLHSRIVGVVLHGAEAACCSQHTLRKVGGGALGTFAATLRGGGGANQQPAVAIRHSSDTAHAPLPDAFAERGTHPAWLQERRDRGPPTAGI